MRVVSGAGGDPARKVFFCSAERGLLAAGGGIISSASLDSIRLTSSLSSGLLGTIGRTPEAASATAASRTSNRSSASRVLSSGP